MGKITEFTSQPIAIRASALAEIESVMNIGLEDKEPRVQMYSGDSLSDYNGTASNRGIVLLLTLEGTMYKYKTDFVAECLRIAEDDPNIIGVVMKVNTPGGSVGSMYILEDALKATTKPVVTLVDGQCCSAGMYVTSFTDYIMAINEMCEVGSIGAMVTFVDDKAMMEKFGIKYIEVYAPESKDKNSIYREAINGNMEPLTQYVSEYARNFQNVMKANRHIDESVDGVLTGAVFFARDAVKYGLVDAIGSLDDAYAKVVELAHNREISSMYNFK